MPDSLNVVSAATSFAADKPSQTNQNVKVGENIFIQPKLSIGAVGDPMEDEADAMADQVMRMPENNFARHQYNSCNGLIQRQSENEISKDENWSVMQQQLADPNFLKLRTPFLERGVPHLWDPDAALSVYKTNFLFFKSLNLSDDLAAKAANFTAPLAIDSQLKAGNPNLWDISDRELNTSSKVFSTEIFSFDANLKNWHFLPSFLQKKSDDHSSALNRSHEQNFIQRKCAHCEGEEKLRRKPLIPFLQKKESANTNIASDAISNQIQSTKGNGTPMPGTIKSFMESRFGADFSNVNIHTGSYASELSNELNAQAFTVGNAIYFNQGKYSPESNEGKYLLAHELTHTIQQQRADLYNIQKQDDDVVSESEAMRDRFREERRRHLQRIIDCNAFHKIRRDCPASTGVRLADVLARMRARIAGNQACIRFFQGRFNINPDIMFDPNRRPSITFVPLLSVSGRTRCPEPTCDSPIPSVSIGTATASDNICNSPLLERTIMHELTHYAHCYRRWGDTGDEATSEQAANICVGTVQQALDAARRSTTRIQPKYINQSENVSESEVDIPDKVMRMPDLNFIQRKCAHCEEEEKAQRKPLASFIQKKSDPNNNVVGDTISSQIQSTKGSGNKMPETTKSFMESRFGADFSNVSIHTGNDAAQLSKQLNAQAFTVGDDIYFNEGRYAPESVAGKHLLAHELTHVVQQTASSAYMFHQSFAQRACLPEVECISVTKGSSTKQFGAAMEAAAAPVREEILIEPPQKAQLRFHGHRAKEIEIILQNRLPELRKLIHHVIIDETLPPDAGAAHVSDCSAWADRNLRPDADKTDFTGATLGCILVPKDLEDKAALYNSKNTNPGFAANPDVEDALQWFILLPLTHEITHERLETSNMNYPTDVKCSKDKIKKELSELAANISEFPIVNNLNKPAGYKDSWIKARLKDKRDPAHPIESIAESIHDIRCSCACADADALIRNAFELASAGWTKKDKNDFHVLMKSKEITALHVYWPFEVYGTGRDEFSLGLGATGSDSLDIAMITYRHVMHEWVGGKYKLSAGLEGNLASPWRGGEFGAGIVGLEYVGTPVTKYNAAPGFIGRLDTGFGVGEFSLQPTEQGGAETAIRGDLFLQLSGGVHFFIPGGTSMIPASIEAAYRLTQPIGPDADRIHSFSLVLSVSLPESK